MLSPHSNTDPARDAPLGRKDFAPSARPCQCTVADAVAWLDDFAEGALAGDSFSVRLLPMAVEHFLMIQRDARL